MGGLIVVVSGESISVTELSVDYLEFARTRGRPWGVKRSIRALNGINFSIKEGDVVALIGRNGSGKSTMLKAIAGLLRPAEGEIVTEGRVALLAGANPGFSTEVTGRQNVMELALAYGVKRSEIPEFTRSILEFADLDDAIDRNIRGYSTGMVGKLGFGFMTTLQPEILLIDETLGVGDAEFREKAQNRLRGFVDNSGSVIISTHSMGLARELCNRGLVVNSGELVADAEMEDALTAYRKLISTD